MHPTTLAPPATGARPVIRVVQPCGALAEHGRALEVGLARLEAAGCEVRWDPAIAGRQWRGYLAGTDSERAGDLVAAFDEPGVDVVWLARGGSGLGRIVGPVVEALAARPPRILVGFSDATSLLNALARRAGRVSFHGPMVASLGRPEILCDLEPLLAVLRGEVSEIIFPPGAGPSLRGVLMGGNLSVLASSAGTPAWAARERAIWLLEDVNEARYRIDRLFTQLREAGLLADAAGLWLGDFGLMPEDELAVSALIAQDAAPLPVRRHAPAGHRGPLAALPIGGQVELDAERGRLVALAPWVSRYAHV